MLLSNELYFTYFGANNRGIVRHHLYPSMFNCSLIIFNRYTKMSVLAALRRIACNGCYTSPPQPTIFLCVSDIASCMLADLMAYDGVVGMSGQTCI